MWKITHTSGVIDWVNGPDKDGAENIYVTPEEAGNVKDRPQDYSVVDGALLHSPDAEAIRLEEVKRVASLIDTRTPEAIESFAYNTNTYKLTQDVVQQVQEAKSLLDTSSDVPGEFPLQINLGIDENGQDDIIEVGTINGFENALNAITAHIRAKREEARALKQSLMTMTIEELQTWSDSRF
jgi:hypothetical protein